MLLFIHPFKFYFSFGANKQNEDDLKEKKRKKSNLSQGEGGTNERKKHTLLLQRSFIYCNFFYLCVPELYLQRSCIYISSLLYSTPPPPHTSSLRLHFFRVHFLLSWFFLSFPLFFHFFFVHARRIQSSPVNQSIVIYLSSTYIGITCTYSTVHLLRHMIFTQFIKEPSKLYRSPYPFLLVCSSIPNHGLLACSHTNKSNPPGTNSFTRMRMRAHTHSVEYSSIQFNYYIHEGLIHHYLTLARGGGGSINQSIL
ncbi:hypothetical protein L873DRAFT_652208 [Choiromyces venosus 120613-1]|uniref:Uncharacterized protein n=1 Tax=Choiromyces venosus 120613-1 TaxID=1336337 RepID=A0A3N4IZ36_9PEZI|nr:hypothetical protein L873DRAFT_652208 [Choiromyces venosus 120613-1]